MKGLDISTIFFMTVLPVKTMSSCHWSSAMQEPRLQPVFMPGKNWKWIRKAM